VFDASPVEPGSPAGVIAALESGDPEALGAAVHNNFEQASAMVVPHVAEALDWVKRADGVLGATVAGSGSAVFAIVREPADAERIANGAAEHGWWGLATRLGSTGVVVTRGEGA
jgi:4-diphosphocytidyl-2-C-methyl-D-erythritol kinase